MRFFLVVICLLFIVGMTQAQNFKTTQLRFQRVKGAYTEKWGQLQSKLVEMKINGGFSMRLEAFKHEEKLEVWLQGKVTDKYVLFHTFNFCQTSGGLGPKFREGDLQIPEGNYYISVFNPTSNFHLSLGLNYPNATDKLRSGKENPGSEIFIHGACVTVGCIPITDEGIKELYVLAVEAKNSGQSTIPVNIYPFRMTKENVQKFSVQYPEHASFWKQLSEKYNRNGLFATQ